MEDRIDAVVPFATGIGFLVAVATTALSDVPSPLPGIALGSEALFYIERGLVVMGAIVVLLMLLVRGLKRELPSEATTAGLGYGDSVKRAVASSETAVDVLAERVDKLEEAGKTQVQAIMLLHQMINDVDKKIDGLQESIR